MNPWDSTENRRDLVDDLYMFYHHSIRIGGVENNSETAKFSFSFERVHGVDVVDGEDSIDQQNLDGQLGSGETVG